MRYDRQQIAREIQATAAGKSYCGNALYVAQDLPEVQASPKALNAVRAALTGADYSHFDLQEAGILILEASKQEKPINTGE